MQPILEINDLSKYFPVPRGFLGRKKEYLRAVDHVSLSIAPGRTLGLVGESGSGKSTVGNLILRLLKPDSGRILYKGSDLTAMTSADFRGLKGKLQVVFQDPQSSLDPRMTIKKIVGYPLKVNRMASGDRMVEKVLAMLREVGLSEEHLDRYPHEFSGGQRQRIGIARALVTEPDFIVFDEPTSALDVSVQAQILNLISGLQKRRGYSYLFISHDLSVIRHISHHIAVMYLGSLVETAPKTDLFKKQCHPYTRALFASVPKPDPFNRQTLAVLEGDPPSPINMPPGCRFHPRCPEQMEICRSVPPPSVRIDDEHRVVCHLYGPEKNGRSNS